MTTPKTSTTAAAKSTAMTTISRAMAAILIILIVLIGHSESATKCYTRKEWRNMNTVEKTAFVNAVKNLANRNGLLTGQLTTWDQFAVSHSQSYSQVYGGSMFYPYHRLMLGRMEELLGVAIPYWDEGFDYTIPDGSALWPTFGFSGNPNNNSCVTTGEFSISKFQIQIPGKPAGCLHRLWDWDSHPLPSSFQLNTEIANNAPSQYYFFANNMMEYSSYVHSDMGGEMSSIAISPYDPVFYLHYAYYDYLWWKWQRKGPAYLQAYNGFNFGIPATADDTIPTVPTLTGNFTVNDVFITQSTSNRFCYNYVALSTGSSSSGVSAVEGEINYNNNQSWPIWAIVVTVVSGFAIIAVIVGVVVVVKMRPRDDPSKFQQMS